MEERNFVKFKKDELKMKEYIKRSLGKGKISDIGVEYTPIGVKIIIETNKPGLVIGRKGEKIMKLTEVLKKRFKLENPHIEISEIKKPEFDAQLIADNIATGLEKRGPLKFKVIAYRTLSRITDAGALGAEIKLGGRLPSERSRNWRFAFGYLKKTGETKKVVDRAEAVAHTVSGVVGVKVAILSPDVELHDRIEINEELINKIKANEIIEESEDIKEKAKKPKKKTKTAKKSTKIKTKEKK